MRNLKTIRLPVALPEIDALAGDILSYNPETKRYLLSRELDPTPIICALLGQRKRPADPLGTVRPPEVPLGSAANEPSAIGILGRMDGFSDETRERWAKFEAARNRIRERARTEMRTVKVGCAECGEPFQRNRPHQLRCPACIEKRKRPAA